jgi:hypothetical protein
LRWPWPVSAAGPRRSNFGSRIGVNDSTVTTTGANSPGAWASDGGRIDIDPTTIIMSGTGSRGLFADSASSVITSSGDPVYTGVKTNASGQPVNTSNVVVTDPAQYVSSGATGAYGVFAQNGGQIWLNADPDIAQRELAGSVGGDNSNTPNAATGNGSGTIVTLRLGRPPSSGSVGSPISVPHRKSFGPDRTCQEAPVHAQLNA